MKKIKGPGIFLAQFLGDKAPFDTLNGICNWASELGYEAVQIPSWESRLIDLKKAAESKDYCDEFKGTIQSFGLEISELSSHLQGQLVAVHPAYDQLFDGFCPTELHGRPKARTEWAVDQLIMTAKASRNLGLSAQVSFSGALLWPMLYPWPQRPEGLVETGFKALADRWMPVLQVHEECGIDLCFEIHPGEDLHDGHSFDMFLEACDMHSRVCINYDPSHFLLQQLDYLEFIDLYHDRIKAFHVKDAEFNPNGRSGVYGGYQNWIDRAGRFRSLGDGQIDFQSIFSKLTEYGFEGWAVLEWECCIKSSEQGAREGAPFIAAHIIEPAKYAFDDFAGKKMDQDKINKMLGL
jgi:sugar phosphate isomerase/epimerase